MVNIYCDDNTEHIYHVMSSTGFNVELSFIKLVVPAFLSSCSKSCFKIKAKEITAYVSVCVTVCLAKIYLIPYRIQLTINRFCFPLLIWKWNHILRTLRYLTFLCILTLICEIKHKLLPCAAWFLKKNQWTNPRIHVKLFDCLGWIRVCR